MKYIVVSLLSLLSFQFCLAQTNTELLKELDQIVANRHLYMAKKEHSIDSLKMLLTPKLSIDEKYAINRSIYEQYNTYKCDSAMRYMFKNKAIARA